jgi:hypothetical protein
MPWIAQINFRQTATFITDAAGQTWSVTDPVLAVDGLYDQNRAGLHFGWTSVDVAAANRSSGADPRIAGIAFNNVGAGDGRFRLDLPLAGQYIIKLVVCDLYSGGFAHPSQLLTILDDTVVLFTQDYAGTFPSSTSNPAVDINGTAYTAAGIISANMGTSQTLTFASTILRVYLGDAATKQGFISHLYVEQVEAVTGVAGGAFNQTIIRTRGRR